MSFAFHIMPELHICTIRRGDESCGVRRRAPLPVPCIALNKATLQRPSPESFSIQARVIQLQIYRLASSSCMRSESQADAHAQATADSCAGTNNRGCASTVPNTSQFNDKAINKAEDRISQVRRTDTKSSVLPNPCPYSYI